MGQILCCLHLAYYDFLKRYTPPASELHYLPNLKLKLLFDNFYLEEKKIFQVCFMCFECGDGRRWNMTAPSPDTNNY